MNSVKDDILVDIPDEDVPRLLDLYRAHLDKYPESYAALHYYSKLKRKFPKGNLVALMSPNNSWEKDGTFFFQINSRYESCFDIFVSTLDETYESLYRGFVETKRLDFSKRVLFYSFRLEYYDKVVEALRKRNDYIDLEVRVQRYVKKIEEALNFSIRCPEDVSIEELKPCDAAIIDSLWPHRHDGSLEYIHDMIVRSGGFGLRLKSNNELVAWVVMGPLNHLVMLEVLEKHKRKGFASILIKYISKLIAEEGVPPFGTIVVGNSASVSLFSKLGFDYKGDAVFFRVGHDWE